MTGSALRGDTGSPPSRDLDQLATLPDATLGRHPRRPAPVPARPRADHVDLREAEAEGVREPAAGDEGDPETGSGRDLPHGAGAGAAGFRHGSARQRRLGRVEWDDPGGSVGTAAVGVDVRWHRGVRLALHSSSSPSPSLRIRVCFTFHFSCTRPRFPRRRGRAWVRARPPGVALVVRTRRAVSSSPFFFFSFFDGPQSREADNPEHGQFGARRGRQAATSRCGSPSLALDRRTGRPPRLTDLSFGSLARSFIGTDGRFDAGQRVLIEKECETSRPRRRIFAQRGSHLFAARTAFNDVVVVVRRHANLLHQQARTRRTGYVQITAMRSISV